MKYYESVNTYNGDGIYFKNKKDLEEYTSSDIDFEYFENTLKNLVSLYFKTEVLTNIDKNKWDDDDDEKYLLEWNTTYDVRKNFNFRDEIIYKTIYYKSYFVMVIINGIKIEYKVKNIDELCYSIKGLKKLGPDLLKLLNDCTNKWMENIYYYHPNDYQGIEGID